MQFIKKLSPLVHVVDQMVLTVSSDFDKATSWIRQRLNVKNIPCYRYKDVCMCVKEKFQRKYRFLKSLVGGNRVVFFRS